jgi:hypothetical protein
MSFFIFRTQYTHARTHTHTQRERERERERESNITLFRRFSRRQIAATYLRPHTQTHTRAQETLFSNYIKFLQISFENHGITFYRYILLKHLLRSFNISIFRYFILNSFFLFLSFFL